MKKFLLLLTLLCTLFTSVKATDVEIGDPAGANASNNTSLPFSSTFNYGWSQQIYTADEIGMAGTINSLSLWIYSTSNISSFSIQIYMAEVDKESFESTSDWVVLSASDLVFTGALTNLPSSAADMAEVTLNLDAPFSYSGQGNLLIAVANNTGSWNGGLNFKVFGETSDPYRALYKNQDASAMGPDAPAAGTRLAKRNVIKLDITAAGGGPTCNKPETVEANDVTANSATINWLGEASAYNLQYKASSDADWTLVKNLTGNSYQLTGLVSNTAYQVQVQAICGENTSGWKSVSFSTLIGLPYAEHFNGTSAPSGWTIWSGQLQSDGSATRTSSTVWSFGSNNGVFDNHARANIYGTGCYRWLQTPAIPIPAMEEGDPGFQMYFSLALTKYSGTLQEVDKTQQQDDRFIVLVSNDDGANWTILREWNNTGSTYVYNDIAVAGEEVAPIDLSAYAGQTILLAFYGESTVAGGDNNIHVDDVIVEKTPTCFKPTDLHAVDGDATSTTLPVAWTANSGEEAWRLRYKPTADAEAEWITLDIATNPYTITGLDAFTEYEIQVAAVCTEEDFTDFGKSLIAKTAAVVPFFQDFDTTALPGEWKRYEVFLEDFDENDAPLAATKDGWNVGAKNGVFGANHLYLNIKDSTDYWLVSPVIEMQAGYQLTFDLALTTYTGSTPTAVTPGQQGDDKFIVFITTDGGANWTALGTWANQGQGTSFDQISTEGQTVKFDLSDYAGQSILLAFYGESTVAGGDNNLHISNVAIDLIPACERPLSITMGNITGTTAEVSWDADEEGNWEYGYVANPAADFVPAETDYTGTATDMIANLSGLSETTDYIFFVRRACSASEKSEPLMKTFKTIQTPAALPYDGDFEETNGWLFINGESTNAWAWGSATANGGQKSLYVSNTSGTSNEYDNGVATVVFATKTFYFPEAGMYSFSYDWKANGEGATNDWDYLRVALAPAGAELEAGTIPTGLTQKALPEGWVALDGGSLLNLQTEWQHKNIELQIEQPGYLKVVLTWKNDGSQGDNPPAAIDNFKISRLSCRMPNGLTLGDVTVNSAAFSWNDDEDGMTWEYACVPFGEEPEAFTAVSQNTLTLDELTENTKYTFYLRKDCGDSKSEIVSMTFKTVNPYQITVNEGTATSSYVPFYAYYADYHTGSQFITPAAQLEAILWDSIKALTFHTSSLAAHDFGDARFDIYVGIVENTTMTANVPFESLTQVASNKALTIEEKMMYIEFDQMYQYQGGNLLVAINETTAGNDKSVSWLGVSATSGSARYEYTTSYGSYGPYSASFLPKMSIDFKEGVAPACSTPKNFIAIDSLTTTTSVKLEWIPVSPETNWVVRYRQQGAEEWIVVPVAQTSLLLEGLTPSTVYEAQVATQCDPLDPTAIGEYSRSISFATLCEIYSIVEKGDFIEGFEAYQGVAYNEQGVVPVCWETGGTTTYAAPHVVESGTYAYVHEGNNALNFCASGSSYAYAVLPEFADSLKHLQISFWAKMENANNGTLYVGYVDSEATFHELITYTSSTSMTYYESNLSTMPDEAKYLAFVWENAGSSYYSCCIDDIKVSYIPSCIKPENVAAIDSLTTPTSVSLTWEAQGAESAWNVLYKKASDSIWNNVVADNDTILLEGLIPSSYYDVRVAAICGVADTSDYSLAAQFVTGCAIISEFPVNENFDGIEGATNKQVLPLCWNAINTTSNSSYNYYPTAYKSTTYSNSGANALRFYSSSYSDPQDQYAILPQMEGINNLRIKFNARKNSASYNATAYVGVMSDPSDTATFVAIETFAPSSTTYEPFVISFDRYAGNGQYIAIKMDKALTSYNGVHIDDIVVEELPNCLEPAGLSVFDIEEHAAKFAWTIEEGSSYVYAVAPAAAGEPADEAFEAASDTVLISGLTDNTDYIVYLRTNCAGSYSPSISAAFHTLMAPATAPYADDFEAGNNWMFINGNLTNAWSYGEAAHNGEGTHAIYISNDGGATNAYTNNAAALVYAVKTFILEEGVYTFQYDWKANGESSYDYLRVALIPDSIELTASTSLPSGLSSTAFPAAWHAIPLDGGEKLNGVTAWQTVTISDLNVPAGAYKVVFLWRDDTSTGTQTPAAIDNFSISKITCLPVAELVVSDITASSATIAWTAPEGQEAWQIAYSADPNFDIAEATPIDVASNPYALADLLTDTLYTVYVRANCGAEDGYSVWSNISFRTAKSCQLPDNLAATDITINSASINWNGYGQTGFNLRYIHGTDTVLVENVESPYALTNLDDADDYYVQVQVTCDEDNWSETLHFVTKQAPATIPYANDFETKNGWAFINGTFANAWAYGEAAHNGEGTHAIYISNNGGTSNAYNASPNTVVYATKLFNFETGSYAFKYDWKCYGEGTSTLWDYLRVVLVPDTVKLEAASDLPSGVTAAALPAGWIALDGGKGLNQNNTWQTFNSDDIAVEAGLYKVVLIWRNDNSTANNPAAAVDNISIKKLTCLKPINLTTSDVYAHSAKLSWSAGEEGQSAWQIALDTIAAFDPDTLSNLIDVNDTSYIFSDLLASHMYYVYVRANCGEDGASGWSVMKSFKTTIACPAPTGLEAQLTPGNGSIATLIWNAGEAQAWQVEYSLNSNMTDSLVLDVTEPVADLTGLTAEATYYARVKADCGDLDGESTYSAIISFKPTNLYSIVVNDGTKTNDYVPVYGMYVDNGTTASQFIVPAESLQEIMWDSITTLTFYASQATSNWGASEFEVYMTTTEDATIGALVDWNSLTQVMVSGNLSIVDNKMVVSLSEPFHYTGDNLLIGFKQTAASGGSSFYSTSSWYGVTANGASIGGYGSGNNMAQRNFLPKMTINYVPGQAPACMWATHLNVSNITAEGATIAWDAVEGANWEYALVLADEEPAAFSAATNPLVLDNLFENTAYVFYLRNNCGEENSKTVSIAFSTIENIESIPYETQFADAATWKLANSDNAWTFGDNLFISNDGVNYAYDDEAASVSYATKLFDFDVAGDYTFTYYWKAVGEYNEEDGAIDFLRVALVPAEVQLTAGVAPEGLTAENLPAGWMALDGGAALVATNVFTRQDAIVSVPAGHYRIAFIWINDDSFTDGDPAAINCLYVKRGDATGIEAGAGIENQAIKFIRDDQVYILLNGTVYTITGQKVEMK